MRISRLLLIISLFLLTGCNLQIKKTSSTGTVPPEIYPDLGEAPELNNQIWINTPEPLRLANLRDKVVLIDMWTFG